MNNVRVWAMRMNPKGGYNSFEFCREKGIIGFGWGLNSERKPFDFKECREMYAQERPKDKAVNTALNAFGRMIENTKKGIPNYVWTIDDNGTYYLCIVDGEYEYISDDKNDKSGVCNAIHCSKYYKVNDLSILPIDADNISDIVRSSKLRGTICEIHSDESKKFSHWLAGFIKDNEMD